MTSQLKTCKWIFIIFSLPYYHALHRHLVDSSLSNVSIDSTLKLNNNMTSCIEILLPKNLNSDSVVAIDEIMTKQNAIANSASVWEYNYV